jgi:predicted nucleic acid-binding Zn finger protein
VGYYVAIDAQTVRCTCPSFVWRRTRLPRGECKHIAAVRALLATPVGA